MFELIGIRGKIYHILNFISLISMRIQAKTPPTASATHWYSPWHFSKRNTGDYDTDN